MPRISLSTDISDEANIKPIIGLFEAIITNVTVPQAGLLEIEYTIQREAQFREGLPATDSFTGQTFIESVNTAGTREALAKIRSRLKASKIRFDATGFESDDLVGQSLRIQIGLAPDGSRIITQAQPMG